MILISGVLPATTTTTAYFQTSSKDLLTYLLT